jgi:hypothetical protein
MSRAPATVGRSVGPFGQPLQGWPCSPIQSPAWPAAGWREDHAKVVEPMLGDACPGWNRFRGWRPSPLEATNRFRR